MLKKLLSLLLISSLLFSPAFARENRWGNQKPPLGSQIDWSSPLARGLVGAWLLNEGGGLGVNNIVKNYRDFTNAVWKLNSLQFSSSPNYIKQESLPRLLNYTLIFNLYPTTISGGINEFDFISDWLVTQRNYYGYISSSKINILNGNGSTSQDITLTQSSILTVNNWVQVIVTRKSNIVTLYINGKYDNSLTGSYSGGITSLSRYFGADNTLDPEYGYKGLLSYLYAYNRALSPSEILSLYIAPYQFIKRPSLLDLFKAAVGGAVDDSQIF